MCLFSWKYKVVNCNGTLIVIGHSSAADIKHFCCVGNSSGGQEREHSCWVATCLWTSSRFLWPSDYSSYCWFRCCNNLLCASSLFPLCCPQSYFCCNALAKLPWVKTKEFVSWFVLGSCRSLAFLIQVKCILLMIIVIYIHACMHHVCMYVCMYDHKFRRIWIIAETFSYFYSY